jgi:hypothetical protein
VFTSHNLCRTLKLMSMQTTLSSALGFRVAQQLGAQPLGGHLVALSLASCRQCHRGRGIHNWRRWWSCEAKQKMRKNYWQRVATHGTHRAQAAGQENDGG